MDIKRLVIKSFGNIEYLDLKPRELTNCVTKDVANAVSYILNNQFAIRHYNTVEPKSDTYLFGELHQYKKGKKVVYTVEINGFDSPIIKKDGVKMTEEEINSDLYISRPYREDNGCIFSVGSRSEFLDYGEFLPLYFSRLTEYSLAFKDVLENRNVYCDEEYLSVGFTRGKPIFYKRKSKNHSFMPYKEVSDYDRALGEYAIFLQLLEMVNYHRQFKSENGIVGVPIIVDGLLSKINATSFNVRFLMSRTREIGRQTFFVEKRPEEFERLVR